MEDRRRRRMGLSDGRFRSQEALHCTRQSGADCRLQNPASSPAEITGFKGVHGVALDSTGKYGYISDGGSNNVAVFDRGTHKVTQTIETGTNPDGILFEPKTERIFAFNGRSKNATVIDTHTNKVVETIALPGKPEFPRADGKGTVFVNIEDTSQIARIDAATAKVTALWSIAPCEEPSGMAIDLAHNRLFSVCGNKQMAVVDSTSGKVVASPAIGSGPDAAAFDATTPSPSARMAKAH